MFELIEVDGILAAVIIIVIVVLHGFCMLVGAVSTAIDGELVPRVAVCKFGKRFAVRFCIFEVVI
jgi:hypothetical protein